MKRKLCILFAALLLLSFTACERKALYPMPRPDDSDKEVVQEEEAPDAESEKDEAVPSGDANQKPSGDASFDQEGSKPSSGNENSGFSSAEDELSSYVLSNAVSGSSSDVGNLRITVDSCTELKEVASYGSQEGYKFVQFALTVENLSSEPQVFKDYGCVDGDGKLHQAVSASLEVPGDIYMEEIGSGEILAGTLTYIMKEASESYYVVVLDAESGRGTRFYGEY